MSTVTITPLPDPRWPEMRPITLRNPSQARLADIINTFARNGVRYKVVYGEVTKPFKYPIAPSFISR